MKISIVQAWRNLPNHESSLNQWISYIRRCFHIVDSDIKDRVSNREQLVPLAVWESGALLKNRHYGWNKSIQMIGIKVDGHHREYFLFFELDKNLVGPHIPRLHWSSLISTKMVFGPTDFGTTSRLRGVWQILYGLNILME